MFGGVAGLVLASVPSNPLRGGGPLAMEFTNDKAGHHGAAKINHAELIELVVLGRSVWRVCIPKYLNHKIGASLS